MKRIGLTMLLVGYAVFIFTSCVTTSKVSFQVLSPAKIIIPSAIIKLSLADNSNLIRGRFFLQIKEGDKLKQKNGLDSALSRAMMYGMIDMLANSPRFAYVEKYTYHRDKTFNSRYDLMDWDEVHSLCDKDTSDALVVLEYFSLADSLSKNVAYNPTSGMYEGSMVINSNALWRIYYPYSDNVYTDIQIRDTIRWSDTSYNSAEVAIALPDRELAIVQACYKAGKKFGTSIAHQWEETSRQIYVQGNADFRLAYDLVNQKKWKEAIDIWLDIYEQNDGNKKLGSYAAFNLSVGYEVLDQLDTALNWAAKAYLLNPLPETDKYIHVLEKRNKQKQEMIRQMEE